MKLRKRKELNYIFNPPVSVPQLILYQRIKQYYKTAELNYPIETHAGKIRWADVAIFGNGLNKEHYLIDVEYDGYLAHKYKRKQDRERDLELKRVGWATVRINKKTINNVFGLIEEAINASSS